MEKIGGDNLEFIMGSGEWRNYTDKIVIAESFAVFAVNIIKNCEFLAKSLFVSYIAYKEAKQCTKTLIH